MQNSGNFGVFLVGRFKPWICKGQHIKILFVTIRLFKLRLKKLLENFRKAFIQDNMSPLCSKKFNFKVIISRKYNIASFSAE